MIKVRAIYEFEFDDSDFDEMFVDVKGLAKDSLKEEMKIMLHNQELCEDDFMYETI